MPIPIDIENARKGDEKAFRHLFVALYPGLKALACRFVDEQTAEDLVQEVFLSYWEQKNRIEAEDIRSFLFKCIQNSCLNYLKHRLVVEEYENKVRIAEARLAWMGEHSDDNEVIKSVISQDLHDIINTSIDKLPPKCAQAFRFCYFQDMSHKDIANAMNISHRTVEGHIRQAVLFLRDDLRPLFILILGFSL